MKTDNPSLQCSVCGQWKRLHGKDKDGKTVQRFYSCCGENGEFEHIKNVCDECCKQNCPYKINPMSAHTDKKVEQPKLLPCPFCGCEPVINQIARNGWEIKCPRCIIKYKQKTLLNSMEWLINSMAETWNARVSPVALPPVQEPERGITIINADGAAEKILRGLIPNFDMTRDTFKVIFNKDMSDNVSQKILSAMHSYASQRSTEVGEWVREPTEPGLYCYTLQGSNQVRIQEVLKSEGTFYGIEKGVLYVVQNADGAIPVKNMKRKWWKVPTPPKQ